MLQMMYTRLTKEVRAAESAAAAAAARGERRKIIMGVAMLAMAEDQFNGQRNE